MKIVRVDTPVDDITYGAVEPEGIRLYRGTPFVAWEPTETVVAWNDAMTLLPGDVILTGTPAGVGPIVPGDRVEVEIEGIGVLVNPVVAG
jgi:hypothetical protein